jgi:hypothetical protein
VDHNAKRGWSAEGAALFVPCSLVDFTIQCWPFGPWGELMNSIHDLTVGY